MKNRVVYPLMAVGLLVAFALSVLWEFALAERLAAFAPGSEPARWESVAATTLLILGGMMIPLAGLAAALNGRARARDAAAEARQRFRDLATLTPGAVVIHAEDKILFATAAAAGLLGAESEADLLERSFSALLSSDADIDVMTEATVHNGVPAQMSALRKTSNDGQADFLRLLIDTIPVPMFYKDRAGRYMGCNRKFEEAMGLAEADIAGKTVFELAPKELAQMYHDADEALFANPGQQIYDAEVKFADGQIHSVVFHKATFEDRNGNLSGLIGAILDVTDRKAHEEASRAALDLLSDAIESLPVGFILCDAEDRLVAWNSRYEEMYPEINVLLEQGRPFVELVRAVAQKGYPADLTDGPEAWVRRRMEIHASAEGTHIQKLRDGRWVQIGERRAANGGVVSVLSDITERILLEQSLTNSEQRYALATEAGKVGVWDWDMESGDIFIATNLKTMLGYGENEVSNNIDSWKALIHPDDRDSVDQALDAHLEGRLPRYAIRYRMMHKDGSPRWVSGHGVASRDAHGAPVRVTGANVDIDDHVNAEKDMLAAKENAEVANRAKTEFLANMSHELRTPLNSIIGFSDILVSESFGPVGKPEYRDYARDINASGHHLLSLINDILDVSRIETESLTLSEHRMDVIQTVKSCHRLVVERAEKAGLRLKLDVPNDLNAALFADERRVKQILINLLSNAVKFTDKGGTVSLSAKLDEKDRFSLVVEDTGIGIAPEDIEAAMTTFGQVDATFARNYEGAGLGLPLSKRLAELHGGELILRSAPGMGTAVTVVFPAFRTQHLD